MSRNAWSPESIFGEAIEIESPEERTAFLDQACGNDPELRHQLEKLVTDHFRAGNFLEKPAAHVVATMDQPITEIPGAQIGPYKLLEQIGEGGFGVVFLAEQQRPVRRQVALKIIKPGMDTREVIARFEAERQALALMDHPNIAKVLDAGTTSVDRSLRERESGSRSEPATTSGRPYFVMELVKGIPITEYCDQCSLTTQERLELFVSVCQAVQHAHQKGIIHRDIKPSNVMIAIQDGKPAPKIIDFGVAKAINQRLTERTLMTGFAQMLGTPLYMSPEQAEMSPLDVDTRSDIYSLGVLLYELLTGTTPIEKERLSEASYDELRRIIREEEPLRPSARLSTLAADLATTVAEHRRTDARRLLQNVRGDLDWIVMKCLEKDRSRRYETVNGLARDVERYLNDEPVQACPPSTWYRLRKFARRNRAALATAALMSAALVLGTVISVWQAIRATSAESLAQARLEAETQARRQAVTEANKATAISNLLQQMLESANPDAAKGTDYTVRQMLDEFSGGLKDQLKSEPQVEAAIRATIGNAYRRLFLVDQAEPHLKAALELRRKIYGSNHVEVARSLLDYGWNLYQRQEPSEAEARAREALAIHRKLGLQNSETVEILSVLQLFLNGQYRYQEAEAVAQEALAIARQQFEPPPAVADILHRLAGPAIFFYGDPVKGERLARDSLALHRKLHGDNHPETAWGLFHVAWSLREQQKFDEAERYYREALAIFRQQFDESHAYVLNALGGLRATLTAKGDTAGLKRLHADSAVRVREAIELDPNNASAHNELGMTLMSEGKLDESLAAFGKSIDINPNLWGAHYNAGCVYCKLGRWDEAVGAFARTVELEPATYVHLYRYATLLLYTGDVESYRRTCGEMFNRFGETTLPHIAVLVAKTRLLVRDAVGDLDRVQKLADRAVIGSEQHHDYAWFVMTKGLAEFRAGKPASAVTWLQRVPLVANTQHRNAMVFALLAMAHQQLDQNTEATKALAEAKSIIESSMPDPERGQPLDRDWSDWLCARILFREADEFLKSKVKEKQPPNTNN